MDLFQQWRFGQQTRVTRKDLVEEGDSKRWQIIMRKRSKRILPTGLIRKTQGANTGPFIF